MYTIKTILAHPSNVQLRIMREVIRAQNLKIDLLEEAADMDSLYEGILRHAPDLVILPDTMFTACINVITDKTDVVCITENRSLSNAGNIRYAYVPVQPPELIQIVQNIYPNVEEEKMNLRYENRRAFLQSLHLPQEYCSAIDIYVQEQRQLNRSYSKTSLFLQRRDIIEKIQDGEFPLEQVKERFQGRRFEATSTFDPYAMRFVEDLGDIVPTQKVYSGVTQSQNPKTVLSSAEREEPTKEPDDEDSSVITPQPQTSVAGFAEEELEGDPVYVPPQYATKKEPEQEHLIVPPESAQTPSKPKKKSSQIGKIVWKQHPGKLTYRKGEPIDFHDGVVLVYRTDGSSYECRVNEEMIRQVDTMKAGRSFVTLAIRNTRFSEQITVLDVALNRITMNAAGRQTYLAGELFDPEGYSFSAVFSDGTSGEIKGIKYQAAPIKSEQTFVTVSYGSASYPVPISVTTKTLKSIEWISKPSKTEYSKGEPLDLTGGLFAATFRDGTREEVKVTMKMLNRTSTKQYGPKKIIVTYMGMVLSFEIMVHPKEENPASIESPQAASQALAMPEEPAVKPSAPNASPEETMPDIDLGSSDETDSEMPEVSGGAAKNEGKDEETNTPMSEKHLEFLRAPRHTYAAGERVQRTEILVKLVDESGNFELINDFTMEPDRPLTCEDHTLKIRYQDLELDMNIQVSSKKVLAVVVKAMPKKLEYIKGETKLDLDGGILAIFYSDATNESIPITQNMVSAFDGNMVGQQIVYVSYQGQQAPIPIIVRDRVMVKVEVVQPPQRSNYTDGDVLDLTGLSLEAIYDNGDREPIKDYEAPEVKVSYGQAVVQMNYHGLMFPVFVHVEKSVVVGIQVERMPDKLVYLENRESLDVSGGQVAKIMNNGEKEIVPMELRMISGFSNQRVGSCRVFVTLDSFQTSFDVQIKGKEAAEIQVIRRPNKLLYFEKEPFDPSGMELKVRYDNNTFETVHDFSFEPKFVERDTNEVTIKFQNVKTTVPIQVQIRSVEAISVAKMPDKLKYKEGVEQIDTRGGKLLVLYNNGSAETIDMYDSMICGFDNTVPGLNSVTVLYENKETKYEIEIIPKVLIGIAIQTPPAKTVYQESDLFDPTGMVLIGYYDNGSSGVLEHFAIKPDGPLAVGTSAIIISYADKMTIVPIQVVEKIRLGTDIQDHVQDPAPIATTSPEPERTPEPVSEPSASQEPEAPPEPVYEPAPEPAPVVEPVVFSVTPEENKAEPETSEFLSEDPVADKKETPQFYASSGALRFKEDGQSASLFF